MLYTKYIGAAPQLVWVCLFTITAVEQCQFTHTQHTTKSFQWRLHEETPAVLPPPIILSQQIKAIICGSKASYNLHLLHKYVSPEWCNFLPTPYKQGIPLELRLLKMKHVNGALKGMATHQMGCMEWIPTQCQDFSSFFFRQHLSVYQILWTSQRKVVTHLSTIYWQHCSMILMPFYLKSGSDPWAGPKILASIWWVWRESLIDLSITMLRKERFANQLETNLFWHLAESLVANKIALPPARKGFITLSVSLFQNSQHLRLNKAVNFIQ